MKQETKIRFEPDTLAKLDALSAQSGHSIAALVRWCVDKSLPVLAGNIERNQTAQAGTSPSVPLTEN